jgi:hypothetical protein
VAICFVRAKVIGRSGGHSAVAAAAYRSGSKIHDERTGITHDYTKKQGVEYSEILSPIAAIGNNEWLVDRTALWNQVEADERRGDAQLSREMIIAIPRELDRDTMIELVREHVRSSYVDRGMVADINLHNLGGNNPHAHVMLTMRELKIDEQGVVSFGNKDRSWNEKKLVETQKKEWEKLANQYLERAGVETRIDARSYEEQGIPRIPQVHVGVAAWRLEKQGIITTPGDRNREVAALNRALENYQAEIAITQLNIETELRLEVERRAAETAAQMERDRAAVEEYTPPEPEPSVSDKENELGKSLNDLLQKWGQRIYFPEDIKLTFYKIKSDQISIYIDGDKPQNTRVASFKFLDDRWVSTVKSKGDRYSVDNLAAMVDYQHHRFDTGEIKKLELTELERREILGFEGWFGLELNDDRLARIRYRGREIISRDLANDLVRWIDKNVPTTPDYFSRNIIQVNLADKSQPVIINRCDPLNSVYTDYILLDTQENKFLDIRHNRGRLEMISGVVTPLISERIKTIVDELQNSEPKAAVKSICDSVDVTETEKAAENRTAFQSILDLVQNRLATPQFDVTPPKFIKNALVTQVDDSEKYFPTRLEIVEWLSNRDCAHHDEIYQLGMQLRAEFMKQDSTIGQPAPDRLPDDYWSDKVGISQTVKAKYDEVEQTQRREAIERAKLLAAEAAREQARIEMVERLIREGNERDKAAATARIQRERGRVEMFDREWETELEVSPVESQPTTDEPKYFPTRAELANWWQVAEIRSEVDLLGEKLKIEYQQSNPGSATVPDTYKSDRVWISVADRERFDQATEPQQPSAAERIAQQREKMRDRVDRNPDRGQSRGSGGR